MNELTAIVTNQNGESGDIEAGDKVFCQLQPDDIVVVQNGLPILKC